MKNKTLPTFSGLKFYLCDKRTHMLPCFRIYLGVEKYVKRPELNWLKIGDVIRGTKIDHQFFLFPRRPGTNSTGGLK